MSIFSYLNYKSSLGNPYIYQYSKNLGKKFHIEEFQKVLHRRTWWDILELKISDEHIKRLKGGKINKRGKLLLAALVFCLFSYRLPGRRYQGIQTPPSVPV